MKHQVRNKKNARKDHLQGSAWTRLAHPNLIPHPHASPLPPQKWPTPQSSPKTLNERTREKKAGASALFNKISTLQPLPIFFFFRKLIPIILTFEYIYLFFKTDWSSSSPLAPCGFDLCELWAEIFVLCPCPALWVGSNQQETDFRRSSSDPGATGMRARAQNSGSSVAIGSKISSRGHQRCFAVIWMEIGWSCNFSTVHLPLRHTGWGLDYVGGNPRARSAWSTRPSRLEWPRKFWRTSTILDVDETWWWISHSLGRLLNRYWATSWSAKKGE